MNLKTLKPYQNKIIYGVAALIVVSVFIIAILIASSKGEDNFKSKIIEPVPLDHLEKEINYSNEDAIFFTPSKESTQSVQQYGQ